jgi:predicted nucleic acid-binding protein
LLAPATPISVQVLNETASVLIRKWHWPWSETIDFLDLVRSFTTVRPLTEQTHDLGLAIARRHLLNIYDALIVAAALDADCDTLYSEDMHAGLVVDGRLRIVNPFA